MLNIVKHSIKILPNPFVCQYGFLMTVHPYIYNIINKVTRKFDVAIRNRHTLVFRHVSF